MTSEFQKHNHSWNQEGFMEIVAENLQTLLTRNTKVPLLEAQNPRVSVDPPPHTHTANAVLLDIARREKEDLHVNKKPAQTELYWHASDKR